MIILANQLDTQYIASLLIKLGNQLETQNIASLLIKLGNQLETLTDHCPIGFFVV